MAVGVHTTQFEIRLPEHLLFERVLSVAADEINHYEEKTGRVIVRVAGVCGPVDQAVREAYLADRLGYDVALLSPGGLASLTEAELVDRTAAVTHVMPVMGFYLQPAVGGTVCCAASRLARRKGTAVLVLGFQVAIKRAVSQPAPVPGDRKSTRLNSSH